MPGPGITHRAGGIPFGGFLPGTVLQNTPDPGRPARGTAKVYIPLIHGPEEPDPQALPEAIVAFDWGGLANLGLIAMPPVGASVLCGFIQGDIERPVVFKAYFGNEGLPSEAQADPPESALTLQHPSGWVIKLDFENNVLRMTNPERSEIELGSEGVKISRAGVEAEARVIHEFGIDSFTGAPLGQITQGASEALRVSQSGT